VVDTIQILPQHQQVCLSKYWVASNYIVYIAAWYTGIKINSFVYALAIYIQGFSFLPYLSLAGHTIKTFVTFLTIGLQIILCSAVKLFRGRQKDTTVGEVRLIFDIWLQKNFAVAIAS